ncbi:MAG: hypothetical protein ACK4IZ_10540 [Flavobacterium sp.]|uniref:hypothetical protein n=1 Tax=Flavobacterium sp. TaxID=239 RepID=UPI00391B27FA
MKYYKILITGFLLMSVTTYSQYYTGIDRRIGATPANQQGPPQPTQKDIEESRNEQIDKQMMRLKEDLKLDDLQLIAIKNEILKSYKQVDILLKKEFSEEDKNKQMIAIQENTEKTILSYLNAEQKEKYMALKNEKPKKKEDKKKRKEAEKSAETNN